MNELLMNGKMLFLQINLILRFSTEKNQSFVHRLPSEVDASLNFQPRVQHGSGSIIVWEGADDGQRRCLIGFL